MQIKTVRTKTGYNIHTDIFIGDTIFVPARDAFFEVAAISFAVDGVLYGYQTNELETKWNHRKEVRKVAIEKDAAK